MVKTGLICFGPPRWLSGKESACQCRRCRRRGFDPWVVKIPWRRKWQPTSVFLPGESHGQRSLMGYRPWGCKESDTTEQLSMHLFSLPRAWVQSLVRELRFHKPQHGQYINNKNTIYVIWMTKIYISHIYLIFTHSFWFTTFQNSWNFLRDKNNGIILSFLSSNPENSQGKWLLDPTQGWGLIVGELLVPLPRPLGRREWLEVKSVTSVQWFNQSCNEASIKTPKGQGSETFQVSDYMESGAWRGNGGSTPEAMPSSLYLFFWLLMGIL